ncbi:hypothetical protein HZS_1810, partial [Henneguya salminicola]
MYTPSLISLAIIFNFAFSAEYDYSCQTTDNLWMERSDFGNIKVKLIPNPTRISAQFKSDSNTILEIEKILCIECFLYENNETIASCLYGEPKNSIDIILYVENTARVLSITILPQNRNKNDSSNINVIIRTGTVVKTPEILKIDVSKPNVNDKSLIEHVVYLAKRYWYIILPCL